MKAALILAISLPLLLLGLPLSGLAQTVGVQSGQWIKYSISMSGGGFMVGQGQGQGWMKVTITDVNWMNVSGTVEAGISGYTGPPTAFYFNVETGYGSTTMMPINLILPANLTIGQAIPGGNLTLAGVTERTYAGASRKVVYATDNAAGATYYWDQATGILVEMSSSGTYGGSAYGATLKATETNIWTGGLGAGLLAPGFFGLPWLFWIIIILAVAGTTTAVIVMRRRKPRATGAPQVPAALHFTPLPPPPPPPPSAAIAACPTCHRPLSYVGQYQRWYCHHCKKYV